MPNADGSVVISVNMDVGQAEKELAKLKNNIQKLEDDISKMTKSREAGYQKEGIAGAVLDTEKHKLQELKESLKELQAASEDKSLYPDTRQELKDLIPGVKEEIKEQQQRVQSLQTEFNKLVDSNDRYTRKLEEASARLAEQKTHAGELEQELASNAEQMRDFADHSDVANQHIVDLSRELEELKNQKSGLEQAGLGLGYQEYDEITAKIATITRELKEYQRTLSQTGGSAEEPVNRTSAAVEKMNSIAGKLNAVLGSTVNWLQNAAKITSGSVSEAFGTAGAAVEGFSGALSSALTAIGPYAAVIGGIITAITIALNLAKKAMQLSFQEAKNLFSGIANVVSKISGAIQTLAGWISSARAKAVPVFKAIGSALSDIAEKVADAVQNLNVFTKISDALKSKFRYLTRMFKRTFMTSVILSGLRAIRSQISSYLVLNDEFTAALARLKGSLLTAFQPIYDVVVPALASLMNALAQAISVIMQFFAALFGTNAKQAQSNAKALYDQANATKAAGEAAEEAAGSLAAFDEINQIQDNSTGGGGGGASTEGIAPDFSYEFEDTAFDSWGEAFDAFLDKILIDGIPKLREGLTDFTDWVNELSFNLDEMFTYPGVKDKVEKIAEEIAKELNDAIKRINWRQLGEAIGSGLDLAITFCNGLIDNLGWELLGSSLAESINGLVDRIDWYEFGRLLFGGFEIGLLTLAGLLEKLDMPELAKAASDIIQGFFDSMTETIEKIHWDTIGQQIADFLNNFEWYDTIDSITTAIATALDAGKEFLDAFIEELHWEDIATQIANAINDSIDKFNWEGYGETLGNFFVHLCDFLRTLIDKVEWDRIGQAIADFIIGFDFPAALDSLAQLIASAINGAVKLVGGFLTEIEPELENIANGIVNALKRFFDSETGVDWTALGQTISNGIKAALTLISGLLDPDLFYTIGKAIGEFFISLDWVGIIGGLTQVLADAIKAAISALKGFLDVVQPNLKEIADGIAQKINEFVHNVDWAELGRTIHNGIEAGLDFLLGILDQLDWESIGDAIVDFLSNLDWGGLMKKWSSVVGTAIGGAFKEIDLSDAIAFGGNIVSGWLTGMLNKFEESGGILGWIKRFLFSPFIDKFKNLFGIHSPSTVMAEQGEYIIAGLLEGLTVNWDSIADFFGEKLEGIKDALSDAWEAVKTTACEKWDGIKEFLGTTWDNLKTTASDTFDAAKEAISTVWDNTKSASFDTWDNIKTTLGDTWESIRSTADTKFNEVKEKISTSWENIKTETGVKWDSLKSSLITTWENIRTSAETKFETIKTAIAQNWTNVKTDTDTKWNNIKSTLSVAWDSLKITAVQKFEDIKTSISSVWSGIISSAKNWGSDICKNLASGISGAISTVTNAVRGIASTVSSFLHFSEPDVGPLSDFHTYMPDMLKLMAQGIRDNTDLAVDAAENLADSISEKISGKKIGLSTPVLPDISKFNIPKIALGAVIPSNQAFQSSRREEQTQPQGSELARILKEELSSAFDGIEIVINLTNELDGKVLTRKVINVANSMTRSSGKSVFL